MTILLSSLTTGGGSSTLNWVSKTSGYLANSGDALMCDTTSNAFTITLPASPVTGTTIYIADHAGTFATNNLTINPNGNNLNGLAQNMVCHTNWDDFTLTYIDSTVGYRTL